MEGCVPTLASESSTPYEQTITLDAYHHQSISYADGFGRTRYSQVFSGTSSPYAVIRTVGTTYDTVGNPLSVVTSDGSGSAQATYSASFLVAVPKQWDSPDLYRGRKPCRW